MTTETQWIKCDQCSGYKRADQRHCRICKALRAYFEAKAAHQAACEAPAKQTCDKNGVSDEYHARVERYRLFRLMDRRYAAFVRIASPYDTDRVHAIYERGKASLIAAGLISGEVR